MLKKRSKPVSVWNFLPLPNLDLVGESCPVVLPVLARLSRPWGLPVIQAASALPGEQPGPPGARNMTRVAMPAVILVLMMCAINVAEARPDVRQMTCKSAAALVKKSGKVVMTTGNHTYDRIMANQSSCSRPEKYLARTRDNKSCFVGYKCGTRTGGD
jgi:hypothetical protein